MPDLVNIRFGVQGSGSVGAIGRAAFGFTAQAEAYGGALGFAVVPRLSVTGSTSVGAVGTAVLVIPISRFTVAGAGRQEAVGRAMLTAPAFRSLFGVYRGQAPLFALRATASEIIEAIYQAYGVNVRTAALTEYTNFPFNHIVRFGGQTLAFTDDELFLLGGDDDNGAPIHAIAELPPTDLDTAKLKRMPYVYIGAKSDEGMKVTAIADERETVASMTTTTGRTRRARIARGVKGRYWAVRIENQNGREFAVDSVEYLPMLLERKV